MSDDEDNDISYGVAPQPHRVKWKFDEKEIFESERALAALLLKQKVCVNSAWWEKDWPKPAREQFIVYVNCNDVFAWGCADAESLSYDELEEVWDYYVKDPGWGTEVWCMKKRREMPQAPVENRIRDNNIWDLDAFKIEHNLRPNRYNAFLKIDADYRYNLYTEWCKTQNITPITRKEKWHVGWQNFGIANPNWYKQHAPAIDDLIKKWRLDNGYDEY